MEKYIDIIDFEGLYQISNLGNIKSFISNKILSKAKDSNGYEIVTLCKNKKRYTKTIHRLVAESFLGKSKLEVNHIDGNKSNNILSNLEYVSKKQNIRHAINSGLFKPNYTKIAVEKRKKVLQINPDTLEVVNVYNSAHEAARINGYSRANISNCCRGLTKKIYNYKWEYAS